MASCVAEQRKGGACEGIARGLSQACVYAIEARKSVVQVYGQHVTKLQPQRLLRSMLESAVSSGVVFGMYFTTYNNIGMSNPLAGPVASLTTSLIKVPIGNCMRMVHVNKAQGIACATKSIVRMQGVRGLYGGYTLSLIEDVIEFDLRTRMYSSVKTDNFALNVGYGALTGMLAAYVTTPFDTIRANMTIHQQGVVHTIRDLYKKEGILALYKGGTLRMCSNGVKYALFFMFFEALMSHRKTSGQ